MSSLFNTTATLRHVTALPENLNPAKGIQLLHDHSLVIQSNPLMTKYEAISRPTEHQPKLPEGRGLDGAGSPKHYRVTDKVHTLPAGLWDSDVVSTYEFFNLENGVFVRIRSPLDTTMETVWSVQERAEADGHELVEEVVVKCSRLILGAVKSLCESGWRSMHEKMVQMMQHEA
ncbi:uncharacterized protein UV8b_02042 [Ustilaginoidea virens]|uniref:DUF7053 domain-containing protein n=1 Tax=Ustilaginoidea virens TaxID=1159556 RepID=A0A8E5HLS9_USTVR|nr:uncharacterized protein UV8b_02042 [Ustilaginoidea virens]QUC17801.1 hypothetical protein UV8b_02042 [Ustilaginoidea virens]